jgi:hypothetical protein
MKPSAYYDRVVDVMEDEENGGYSGVAWACFADGAAYPLEGLGIYEKETTHSLETDGYGEGGQVLLCRPKTV